MLRRFSAIAILLFALAVAPRGIAAQKDAVARDAAISVLMEEIDSVNVKHALQSRELEEIKKRVAELQELLQKSVEETRAKVDAEIETYRNALKTSQARLDELESRQTLKGRKLPWLIPMLEFRLRTMYDKNRTDTDSSRGDSDFFIQQRLRVGLTFQPWKNVQGVAILQDSREWAEEKTTTSNQHSLDLFHGYMLFEDIAGSGVWLQGGRFSMKYGSGRQVSLSDFHNVGQVFDGIRIGFKRPKFFQADAFAVLYKNGFAPVFQPWGQDRYSIFSGLYLSCDASSYIDAELYGFYQDNGFVEQTEKIGTVGARLVARPVKGLLVEGEASVQFGKVTIRDESAQLKEASHVATAYFLQAKYSAPVKTSPWIGMFVFSGSGDANPFDSKDVSYRPLFPHAKGNMGNMGLFRWQGVWDIGPSIGLLPVESLKLSADYHFYSLTSDGGNLQAFDAYLARSTDTSSSSLTNRVLNVPAGGSRFLGHELDIEVLWKPMDILSFGLGYSFFMAGAATRRSQVLSVGDRKETVGAVDVTTPYWRRDYRMGGDTAHRFWLEATLSL
jgi:hypothetical protein